MAATITEKTGAEVTLEPGGRGEFTVWVGEQVVAEKTWNGFPKAGIVAERVAAAL